MLKITKKYERFCRKQKTNKNILNCIDNLNGRNYNVDIINEEQKIQSKGGGSDGTLENYL